MTAAVKILVGGRGFLAGGQFGSRGCGQLAASGVRGLGQEKQLPRRLRCPGLAALRAAVGLPPY
ncbi:MAG TPA: hypothetical protein VFO01_16265 [Trebonia sp.]|nr:hypothetical protein [Trebonia sp.]